jgi:hypothetical protein
LLVNTLRKTFNPCVIQKEVTAMKIGHRKLENGLYWQCMIYNHFGLIVQESYIFLSGELCRKTKRLLCERELKRYDFPV